MVIRLVSVSIRCNSQIFHDVFRTILGWRGDLGYLLRVHGQEFNSFRRKTQSKAFHELKPGPKKRTAQIQIRSGSEA
jgi:hypothetical protein